MPLTIVITSWKVKLKSSKFSYLSLWDSFLPSVETTILKNLCWSIPMSTCVNWNERGFLGRNKVQEGKSSRLYFCASSQIIAWPWKCNSSPGFSFTMSQMEMTVPISCYMFLPYLKKKKKGIAIRINEMMFVNSFELFRRQMFYKYKLLIKYLYWWLQGALTVLE